MNLPNILTLCRIAAIPVFALAVLYYGAEFKEGTSSPWLRWLATGIFLGAVLTDALDGFFARRLHQKTRLGTILDPLADKLLLLTALVLLCWNNGDAFPQLPLWLPVLVLSRDIIVVLGITMIFMLGRGLEVRTHWIGKVATVLQMTTLALVLLGIPGAPLIAAVWLTGLATFVSGTIYFTRGVKLLAG
ncbi:MAG: CDP-alcohol phosphatidyltransferase family protein [Verrucomicrobiia bacterium]